MGSSLLSPLLSPLLNSSPENLASQASPKSNINTLKPISNSKAPAMEVVSCKINGIFFYSWFEDGKFLVESVEARKVVHLSEMKMLWTIKQIEDFSTDQVFVFLKGNARRLKSNETIKIEEQHRVELKMCGLANY